MIEGKQYIEIVKKFFLFLISEFQFEIINEKIRGNAFYDVQYATPSKIVSVNYENIENYFQVIIFMLQNGKMPNYDDKTKTLHLNKLSNNIMSQIDKNEIVLNNEYFINFISNNEIEKKILKSAKELRLCLNNFNL